MDRRPLRHDPDPQHRLLGQRRGEAVGGDVGARGQPLTPDSPDTSSSTDSDNPAITGPLVLWFAVQLGALLLSLLRLPLAAAYPPTGELLAAHVMVISQVVAAAILFPYLMRTWPAAVAVVASAWPFDAVAGVFSAAPAGHVVWAAAYVTAWLLVLAIWNRALPERSRGAAVAAAALVAVGGCAMFYLRLEFRPGENDAADAWAIVPAVPTLAALRPLVRGMEPIDWIVPAAAASLGIVGWHFLRRQHLLRRSDQVIHKS